MRQPKVFAPLLTTNVFSQIAASGRRSAANLRAFPEAARPLLEYHEVLLCGDSPFSAGERELIAAYVSGLNNCNHCHAVHSQTAVALGISADAVSNLISNPRNADVDVRMQPVLGFVRKLTLSPGKVAAADVDPIFAAGWNDRALHDATAICALFNLMNRLVNGLGVEAPGSVHKDSWATPCGRRLCTTARFSSRVEIVNPE